MRPDFRATPAADRPGDPIVNDILVGEIHRSDNRTLSIEVQERHGWRNVAVCLRHVDGSPGRTITVRFHEVDVLIRALRRAKRWRIGGGRR